MNENAKQKTRYRDSTTFNFDSNRPHVHESTRQYQQSTPHVKLFRKKNKDPYGAPAHAANDQGTGRNTIAQRADNKPDRNEFGDGEVGDYCRVQTRTFSDYLIKKRSVISLSM